MPIDTLDRQLSDMKRLQPILDRLQPAPLPRVQVDELLPSCDPGQRVHEMPLGHVQEIDSLNAEPDQFRVGSGRTFAERSPRIVWDVAALFRVIASGLITCVVMEIQ